MAKQTQNQLGKILLWAVIGALIGLAGYFLFLANPAGATVNKKAYCHKNSGKKEWTYHFNKAWTQHFRNNGSPKAGHEGDFLTWKGNRECIKGEKPTPTPTPTPPICKWSEWSECSAECGGGHQERYLRGDGCSNEKEQRRCNTHECPLPTTRMCHWEEDGFEAIAVTKKQRIWHFRKHKLDKDWVEGMDADCEFPPEPTPTPTPDPTPAPKREPSPAGAPQCTSTAPVLLPANPLVWRKGGTAIVQWQPTDGNRANVYYYQNQDSGNAHAVRDTENDGYVEIHELGGLDWTFGIQQANDCAGGETVWVVDGLTNGWVLFTP